MSCGKINLCENANCGYKCCNFSEGNYILLLPDELDNAIKNGENVEHLSIIAKDEFNGHKAICTAINREKCDNGYKPLDCLFYPFFPREIIDGDVIMDKGEKCPLKIEDISNHAAFVTKKIKEIFSNNKSVITKWLKMIRLVGYNAVLSRTTSGKSLVEQE